LTAVAVGGGFTYRAVTNYASVVRSEGDHPVEGRVTRQSYIYPGDVITIYERWI
jgi:polysaccharide biosynthesis/export protein